MESPALVPRRSVVAGLAGLAGLGAAGLLASCTSGHEHGSSSTASQGGTANTGGGTANTGGGTGGMAHDLGRTFPPPTPLEPTPGQRVVAKTLTPAPTTADLGGLTLPTWAYDGVVPGPLIRATAGDLVRITLANQLPAPTTVHWHGIRLRNEADGVPGLTQAPIAPGATYRYDFVAPDPGTYFFHSHVGVQIDRGLYGALIIDDPREPGDYDAEWVVVLDDWLDGTGKTPDDILAELIKGGGGHAGHGMGMGGMGDPPWGPGGDVTYPHYLVNGRIPVAAETFTAKPGQRVRIRLVNASADTIFAVALGGHRLTVTHSDGYAVRPTETGALYLGMGERYDVVTTLKDGVFPLVAAPFGKQATAARALVRTGSGEAPPPDARPAELGGPVLTHADLAPTDAARLPNKAPDSVLDVVLGGGMGNYAWTINGAAYGKNSPLQVTAGQRTRLRVSNMSMMTHPFHLHGHTFAVASTGLRKDTLLVRHMELVELDFDADNRGSWMAHCHNAYHGEAGMMIELAYRS